MRRQLYGFSLTCVMTSDGGRGKMTYTAISLGLLRLPWSDLTEKAWNQTLTHLRLPGLNFGGRLLNDFSYPLLVLLSLSIACVAGVRMGRGRELGRLYNLHIFASG